MTATKRNTDVFKAIETWAPKHLAYDWDNVGLQVGSFHKPVKKVMVTLDVLESTADEAIENNVDLIIAHHPLLFKSMKQVNVDTAKGRTIQKLLQHDISVYAAHTNLDTANGGVNDMLCDLLGIQAPVILEQSYTEQLLKIAVFVPETHAEEVRDAMSQKGAGHIGDYSHCTFQSPGQGTFMPLDGTDPYIGKQGELEFVDEVKMETIIPAAKLTPVIDAMTAAHPYEEAAYDIYPVENSGEAYGIGRIGRLSDELTLEALCEQVKTAFDVRNVRVTGDLSKKVNKVAILGGSGEKYIHKAKQMGADVYITGDMTFHTAQDAQVMGLSIIDPGHYVEKVMKACTKSYLDDYFTAGDIEVIVSKTNTEPFQFI
ncbi:Nif3-like dinuclear metal center hexameric protein [Lentibacillus sp. CBA3610]|uniref:Nif3-like dinuclear metal center hexameric protein n=1 Tax=Lentibacillus sp. CBA3610 TaxID=2518176 RepID=UPI00159535C5|nr:Nif3-like dinuclear metal center hexameric protein [Lentibacillus sp. CBA3610]QKY69476.1 Nif3-like dinuclear metal center hexameric protein [Lentibacillus sp. CBA3610]